MGLPIVIQNRFSIWDEYTDVNKTYVTQSFRRYFPLAYDYYWRTGKTTVKVNRCVFDFDIKKGIVRFFGSKKDFELNVASRYYFGTV